MSDKNNTNEELKEDPPQKAYPQAPKILPPVPVSGVTTGAAKKVYETLKQGRRYFGSSGAALTYQLYNKDGKEQGIDPALAKVGLEGEHATTTFLLKWMKKIPSAVLVDSCHIQDWDNSENEIDEELGIIDGGDTDHLLIIGNNVLVIDTKKWKRGNYVVSPSGSVLRANKNFPGSNVKITKSIYKWLDYIDEPEVALLGYICINNDKATVFRNREWYSVPYQLVEIERFGALLDEKLEQIEEEGGMESLSFINTSIVSQIVVSAVKPYNQFQNILSDEVIKNFK